MLLNPLKSRPEISKNKRLNKAYIIFQDLLLAIEKKTIPSHIKELIKDRVDELNNIPSSDESQLKSVLKTSQSEILKILEKDLKFVSKHHHRNMWIAIGMAVFGVPLGVCLGLATGNMGLLGLGLPIGMPIGMAIGSQLDNKVKASGLQLDIEVI